MLRREFSVRPGVATWEALRLATMRELYAAAGQPEVFAAYLAELRECYARRTSFIAALERRGLT